jgi:UDP-N-acetylmuramoyl-tripeptide--D-alanyl-D-alanine ligase
MACRGVAIDTRTLEAGEAFVALQGERFDGHAFLAQAEARGAACLIVSHLPADNRPHIPVIVVADTAVALADLARAHRRRLNKTVIAVTGSCGKTTTKDLIAHILGGEGLVLKSQGTQNNHIGVPLTLLRLQPEHRYAVVELGSNHPGEIAALADIAQPNLAVITNVGPAHLEYFGSLMGVLQEKLSLLSALSEDGTAILPGDQLDVYLEAPRFLPERCRVIHFGTQEHCTVRLQHVRWGAEGLALQLDAALGAWHVPLVGAHNAENALAAIACTWALGLPMAQIKARLENCVTPPMRSELIRLEGIHLLNDAYNANPLSCARALETLLELPSNRRIAVLGDMLELGDYAPAAHQAIGRMAAKLGIHWVVAVGEYARYVAEGVRETRSEGVDVCRDAGEALACIKPHLRSGDSVLIKGSRRLGLESITESLRVGFARQ